MTWALKQFKSDSAKQSASIGLQRLNPEAFGHDYNALTAIVGDEFMVRLRSSLATLTDEEMAALANALRVAGVGDFLQRLQQTPIQAGESESQFWYRVSRDPLAAWLKRNAS